MRSLTATTTTAIGGQITEPNFLVELPVSGGLKLATRSDVTITGELYEAGGCDLVRIRDWESATVRLRNPAGVYTAEILGGNFRGGEAKIYILGASDTPQLLFVGEAVAAPGIGEWIEFTLMARGLRTKFTPRTRVGAPTFNHLAPPGAILTWDGETYELRGSSW